MSDLKKEAEGLGIDVNPRWSDETLKKKIDEAKAAKTGTASTHEATGTAPDAGAAAHELQGRQPAVNTAGDAKPEIDARARLVIAAEVLGIAVGADWDEARLNAEIQAIRSRDGSAGQQTSGAVPVPHVPAVPGLPKTPYKLLRDYWDDAGERHKAGADVLLTDDEARRLGPNVLQPKSVFA